MDMRLLPALGIVLALFLAAVALPTVSAEPGCRWPGISLSADRGVPGDIITISGIDFDAHEYVEIYYDGIWITDVRPRTDRQFTVDVEIPSGPTGQYTVRAIGPVQGETFQRDAVFRVIPGMSVSPESGPIGTEVTVQGLGFGASETGIEVRYYLNGVRGPYQRVAEGITADVTGSWEASFTVPEVAGGEYEISARGSQTFRPEAIRHAVFRVGPGISLGARHGAVGESVPVSGRGFGPNEPGIRVLVDGRMVPTDPADIQADAGGHWQATFEVPDRVKGEYGVTAGGDTTSSHAVGEVAFEIRPGITLSPAEGHVGMHVTVTGRGFAASSNVVIKYDDDEIATVTADAEGRFETGFTVPESPGGERRVTARNAQPPNSTAGAGNALAIFTMESDPPPTPELIAPVDEHRTGFLFRATPTMEWSGVFDVSGVYYSIQVSTSPERNEGGFVYPLFAIEGLTETSYTSAERLPYGTYYWMVQAVDGARNKGEWTAVDSFRVGRLPMWAFIAILSFVGLVLVLRTYLILVKPRLYE